jgi:hypothetical protein
MVSSKVADFGTAFKVSANAISNTIALHTPMLETTYPFATLTLLAGPINDPRFPYSGFIYSQMTDIYAILKLFFIIATGAYPAIAGIVKERERKGIIDPATQLQTRYYLCWSQGDTEDLNRISKAPPELGEIYVAIHKGELTTMPDIHQKVINTQKKFAEPPKVTSVKSNP